MSDTIQFPGAKDIVAELFGPETSGRSLIVEGRLIPNITVRDHGQEIEFVLDGRFSFSFDRHHAHQAASFAAQAMAIGAGYSWLGAPDRSQPFAPQVIRLSDDISTP